MSPSTHDYLRHILDEAQYLTNNSPDVAKNVFLNDETLKRAYVRSIEVIGEAVKQIPDSL